MGKFIKIRDHENDPQLCEIRISSKGDKPKTICVDKEDFRQAFKNYFK